MQKRSNRLEEASNPHSALRIIQRLKPPLVLQNPPTRVGNLSTASADFVSLAAVLTAELSEVRNVGLSVLSRHLVTNQT